MNDKKRSDTKSRSIITEGESAAFPDVGGEEGNKPRRRALKALVAGGALTSIPASWNKPVVDLVILPSHAQSTPGVGACINTGPCTPGMNVNIIAANLSGGDLIVVGDTQIPTGQNCGLGPSDSPPTWSEPQLICALLDSSGLIQSETFATASTECASETATATGCLVSCSISIGAGGHSVGAGDCVTLRFTFAGGCVCSGVATVS